ncbi:protein phosphatase 2C domain-containing protein [Embleya sp. NBC_00896]|uniref:protein phosphatase 2C domain-containing protein n=1 Tax=Embleya sp. NBC_00896 TaxID=2975961 RepID=UPI00386A6E50|nr:protein phosphatase 2C domain-containing protein [Embleya sp. NBC_00896]
MPDGTSKRHTPGDGSPAEPIPRAPDPRRPGPTGRERQDPEYDHNGEQVEGPLGFPDLTQDQAGRRSGRARRVANWFGFGAPPEEDEPDPYDRRPGFGRRDPYEADTGVYDYGRDQDADYDGDFEAAPAPTSGRTRRRTGSSHWEDVMLGSSPSPGTPMSDSIPGDTMPPDRLHREPPGTLPPTRGTSRPGRREEATRWQPELDDDVEPADPMDPVDPLDPGPTPSSERRIAYPPIPNRRPAPAAESDRPSATEAAAPVDDQAENRRRDRLGDGEADDDGGTGTTFVPVPPAPRTPYRSGPDDGAVDEVPRRMLRMLPPPALADGGGMVVDGGRLGRLNVRAAGVRGELHQQQGLPRQNCFAVGPDPSSRWTIAIVCDGIDNAHASELAAQIAVRSAYRTVARMVARERHENWDWAGVQTEVEEDLRVRLAATADRAHELGRSEPATRLAILVTAADPLEDDRVDMAVLGDSTVLRLAQGGWRAPLGIRDTSMDAAPAAIPDQAGDDQLRICRTTWRPTDVLVMMTGGFAEALGQPTAGLAPRLAEDWRTPPSLFDYLRDVDEGLRLREDDGCVVALWPSA